MKRFNLKAKAGFTLVELIVVIAILAILAGVAIPAYSGYIKKANEASDQMLLAAVNTAFGAAVIENSANPHDINATAAVSDSGVTVNPYNDSFQKYYAGNGTFKVFKSLVYDKAGGVFVGSKVGVTNNGDGTYNVVLANGNEVTYTVSDTDKNNINNSTYGTEMSMGDLMGDVSGVVGSAVNALSGSEANKVATLRNLLGGDDGLTALGLDPEEEYTSAQLGNALVVAVAKNTGDSTKTAIINALNGGGVSSLYNSSNMPETLANVAAAYGLMEGYANSPIGKTTTVTYTEGDETKTATVYEYFTAQTAALMNSTSGSAGLNSVLSMMNTIVGSSGISQYSESQLAKDLDGYISAMGVIGENVDTIINGNNILDSGFNDTDLIAILNGILGED